MSAMLLGLASVSCSSVRWVSIERLVPAEMEMPSRARRVAVLDNQPKADTSLATKSTFLLDSKCVADTLAQYLADAAYFDEVVVGDTVLSENMLLYYEGRELRPSAADRLCKEYGADLLVTVDYVTFIPSGVDLPYAKGQLRSYMTCYRKGGKRPVASIQKRYSFDWEHWHFLKREVMNAAAALALPTIVPRWQVEEFPFFTGANIGQRDAAVYVREGKWDEAAALWRRQLTHRRRDRRMEAHLNMAIYHEIKDDSGGTARTYAKKALELAKDSYDRQFIGDYMKELERRGRDLERVRRQMHGISDDF